MTKEEKIKKIYETISNKELTFGCKVAIKTESGELHRTIGDMTVRKSNDSQFSEDTSFLISPVIMGFNHHQKKNVTVVGHPVMIGDVLQWFKINRPVDVEVRPTFSGHEFVYTDIKRVNLHSLRTEPRIPIESQSDKCIDYIYGLVSD